MLFISDWLRFILTVEPPFIIFGFVIEAKLFALFETETLVCDLFAELVTPLTTLPYSGICD